MADRTVHALATDGRQVVRYNRAGAWYAEGLERRQRIRLIEAASMAAAPGARWYEGLSGGLQFDAAVRRIRGAS